jgi:hypothetical protein
MGLSENVCAYYAQNSVSFDPQKLVWNTFVSINI